jgi:hypothetical protein
METSWLAHICGSRGMRVVTPEKAFDDFCLEVTVAIQNYLNSLTGTPSLKEGEVVDHITDIIEETTGDTIIL